MSSASKPHKRPDDSWCPTCDEYQNDAYWDLVEQLEAAHKVVEAARVVNEELATWEPTERSRTRLHNALLGVPYPAKSPESA